MEITITFPSQAWLDAFIEWMEYPGEADFVDAAAHLYGEYDNPSFTYDKAARRLCLRMDADKYNTEDRQ